MDPEKKEILLHENANLRLHGTDCLHAETKARSEAKVYPIVKKSSLLQS